MKLKEKKTLILTSIITLLPMLVGILLWKRLPQEMATHFDSSGEANGWSSKWFAVIGLPLFLFLVNILCTVGCAHDPGRAGYRAGCPEKMMKIIYWICPVISWICAVTVYGYALGFGQESFARYIPVLVGLLLVVIGNYLPKVSQNYYLGIKLPWTFADEENWNKTHRLGGRVWVVGGILMMLNFFMRIRGLELVILLAMVLIPVIYSWTYSIQKSKS